MCARVFHRDKKRLEERRLEKFNRLSKQIERLSYYLKAISEGKYSKIKFFMRGHTYKVELFGGDWLKLWLGKGDPRYLYVQEKKGKVFGVLSFDDPESPKVVRELTEKLGKKNRRGL